MSTPNRNESSQNNAVQWSSTSSDSSPRPSTLEASGTRQKSLTRQKSQWQIELEKQRKLMTAISVHEIPIQNGEDVRALFFQLCANINLNISHKGLNDVHRDTNTKSILVDLKTIDMKRNMFRAWRQASMTSITFLGRKLSSKARPGRISITDAKTPYYTMLHRVAQNAVDDGIFDDCEININGLEIICDNGRKKSIVLSLSEMDDLIDRYSKR